MKMLVQLAASQMILCYYVTTRDNLEDAQACQLLINFIENVKLMCFFVLNLYARS